MPSQLPARPHLQPHSLQELCAKQAGQAVMHSKQAMLQLMLLAQLSTAFDSAADNTSKVQAASPASTAASQGRHLLSSNILLHCANSY